MRISVGSKLGPYEITALIGEGGMGRVFRARDSALDRQVALKVLPDAWAHDSDRLARLEREARLLASLNHPNIAGIHHLERSGDACVIVMEFVPGDTLAQRVARGQVPFDEAGSIAIQIARALEVAHAKGIIHRDLKPANVKITPDATVKLLDFGLAKAFDDEPASGAVSLTHSPTMLGKTGAGVILGTAAYMSPEQARGQRVDSQTDIWAFGCVLYEMLTGRQTFNGATVTDILAAIVRAEPDWSALPVDTPDAVRLLLRRCLQKDPAHRVHHIADARIELEEVSARQPGDATSTVPAARGKGPWAWLAMAATAIAAVGIAGVVLLLRQSPPALPEMLVELTMPAMSDPISFAISPDGSHMAFVASVDGASRLWVRPLATGSARSLAATDGAQYPFWSPDSRSIGFFADNKLKRIDVAGGAPRDIVTNASSNGRGAAWTTEGIIVFSPRTNGPLFKVPASGGPVIPLTTFDATQEFAHRFPHALPDGRFLYLVQGKPEKQGVYLAAPDGSSAQRVIASDVAGAYASGWLFFMRSDALLARRFDPARATLGDDQMTIAEGVGADFNLGAGSFSVAANGVISYRAGNTQRSQLTWFDRSGKAVGTLAATGEAGLESPELSPDGRRATFERVVQGNTDVWLADGSRDVRFTFDASIDHMPIWSPDGSRIAFDSTRKTIHDLYVKSSSGAGADAPLLESPANKILCDWSPDGRTIVYASLEDKTGFDLWVLPLEGDRTPKPLLVTAFDEIQAQFSPDGRWIAYRSNQSQRTEVYVRSFSGPEGQWQVSTQGGTMPRWAADGKELYYVALDGTLMAVPIAVTGAAVEPGTPVALFPTRMIGGRNTRMRSQYDVAQDGRFLVNVVTDTTPSPITLLLNWKPK